MPAYSGRCSVVRDPRNNILVVDIDPLEDMLEQTCWRTERKVASKLYSPVWLQWRGVKIKPLLPFKVYQRSRWQ